MISGNLVSDIKKSFWHSLEGFEDHCMDYLKKSITLCYPMILFCFIILRFLAARWMLLWMRHRCVFQYPWSRYRGWRVRGQSCRVIYSPASRMTPSPWCFGSKRTAANLCTGKPHWYLWTMCSPERSFAWSRRESLWRHRFQSGLNRSKNLP